MRHIAALLLAVAALAALPGRVFGQRALKDSRLWGVKHASDQRLTVWNLSPAPDRLSAPKPTVSLTVRTALPTPPRMSLRQSDLVLAGAFTAALLIDAGQTRGLARGGWRNFRETNPILGPRPSVGQVNTYTAVSALTVLGAAAALPARIRPWLLGAALVAETFTIAGSARQGIAIGF